MKDVNIYEFRPGGSRRAALENVVADIQAASRLGIPFTVQTVKTRAFRGGGNVNKADVLSYRVTVHELTDERRD